MQFRSKLRELWWFSECWWCRALILLVMLVLTQGVFFGLMQLSMFLELTPWVCVLLVLATSVAITWLITWMLRLRRD